MAVRSEQRVRTSRASLARAADALGALADAGATAAAADGLGGALRTIAQALGRTTGAEAAVIRVAEPDGTQLRACAVAGTSTAVAAELEGTLLPLASLAALEVDKLDELPATVARAARRVRATAVLQLPVTAADEVVGSIELLRIGVPFDETERMVARFAAAQAALAIRAFRDRIEERAGSDAGDRLSLAGEALVAGSDEAHTAEHVTRVAAEATGAAASLLWRRDEDQPLELVGVHRLAGDEAAPAAARQLAERALLAREPLTVETLDGGSPDEGRVSATLQLGQPPLGALQLLFRPEDEPSRDELARLMTFGVRAAHALRASSRSRELALELERTRALLAVVGQAIAQLSLAHTLETAVARVAELLDAERLAVYLRGDGGLYAAAGVGLAGPHARFAERLLELTVGRFRARGMLAIADVRADARLTGALDAAAEAGIEAAVGVPLLVHDEPIGLLGVYPDRGRVVTENESALLIALAGQLAVAVQNARLHEETKRLGEERERALESERAASRQLGALYEISRSFAQSLDLDATLNAVASTIVDVLDLDMTLIRLPDERQELLLPRALSVAEPRLEQIARTIIWRPHPFGSHPFQRLFRLGETFELTPETTREIGESASPLVPFLERGWTGAVVPIATTSEVLASLTLISMRPESPVTRETLERAVTIAGQAALAIDNARLYQQQKQFADTMQRSLLPRTLPALQGLELGHAYESAARVEVGGDVYDFMELDDGRLAAVLGDVTGHGIEAAADMALAKFVFRSLAREHPQPRDFLRSVNDVVVGEVAPGKFITMVYLAVDVRSGEVIGAGAGHPPPRIVDADGKVHGLEVRGIALGIERGQEYEEARASLDVGGAVVLYTDGVLEARWEGELYGFERLDALIAAGQGLSAEDLAQTILADCRDFAHNELADDCAVVVIKRTA
jgi:serine phosphatase RsbU (regulator of sigma subunit)